MEDVIGRAAARERETHSYQNRTEDLQNSTQAEVVSDTGDTTQVDLVMGMEYASFVNARGLSNIDEVFADAERELTARFVG